MRYAGLAASLNLFFQRRLFLLVAGLFPVHQQNRLFVSDTLPDGMFLWLMHVPHFHIPYSRQFLSP